MIALITERDTKIDLLEKTIEGLRKEKFRLEEYIRFDLFK